QDPVPRLAILRVLLPHSVAGRARAREEVEDQITVIGDGMEEPGEHVYVLRGVEQDRTHQLVEHRLCGAALSIERRRRCPCLLIMQVSLEPQPTSDALWVQDFSLA